VAAAIPRVQHLFERHLDPAAVASRRAAEATRAVAPMRNQLDQVEASRRTVAEEMAAVQARLDSRTRVRDLKVERLKVAATHRIARYWRILVRHHPDGPQLTARLAAGSPDLHAPGAWLHEYPTLAVKGA
jgi:hypothetical protein